MKNHDFLFDKDTQTVGMVRANCSAVLDITTPQYSTEHPSASSSASPSEVPEPELMSESTKSGSEPSESSGNENAPTSQTPDQKEPSAAPVEFTGMTEVSVNNDNDENYWSTLFT